MRKIIMITFAYEIPEYQIKCLEIYIEKYIEMHKKYYSNSYPKLHYLIHVPDQIRQ